VQRTYNPNSKLIAEMMQADLAKVGINATLVTYEWGEYRKRMQQGEEMTGQLGWTGDNGDPDNFLFLLGCAAARDGGQNIARFCNKEFEDKLQGARQSTNTAERTKLYEEMQVIVHDEAPWFPIAHSVVYEVMSNKVTGYKVSPLGRHEIFGVDIK
jgi:dipeptide transport system substrate-binding protein